MSEEHKCPKYGCIVTLINNQDKRIGKYEDFDVNNSNNKHEVLGFFFIRGVITRKHIK